MSQAHAEHAEEHASVKTYIVIAVILTFVTMAEVATFYVHIPRNILIPLLVLMSGAKFFTVVGWYMHLKYDARIFRRLFFSGLILGAVILTALVVLFTYHGPIVPG